MSPQPQSLLPVIDTSPSPDRSLLPVVDTVRMTVDGVPMYIPEDEVWANVNWIRGILWAMDHPGDVMRGLAWTAAVGAAAIMAYDTLRPHRRRR